MLMLKLDEAAGSGKPNPTGGKPSTWYFIPKDSFFTEGKWQTCGKSIAFIVLYQDNKDVELIYGHSGNGYWRKVGTLPEKRRGYSR